jgi:hypothetical protein
VRVASKPARGTNYFVPIGPISQVYLTLFRAKAAKRIGVYLALYGAASRETFEALRARRDEIEAGFGGPLGWLEQKPDSTYWVMAGRLDASGDEQDWPRQHAWLAETMKRLGDAVGLALQASELTKESVVGSS